MTELFDKDRANKFVKRASHGKNLGQDIWFDTHDDDQAEEMVLGLLTEFADNADQTEMSMLALASDYLTKGKEDKILRGIHAALRYGEKNDKLRASVPTLVGDIAGIAARSLRNNYEARKREEAQQQAQNELKHDDTGDLIRQLFENGVITPGHAAALLVYFRLEEPRNDSDRYEQLMRAVQRDLDRRIRTLAKTDKRLYEADGIKIIRSYMTRRDDEEISLNLPEIEDTWSVNRIITKLYTLKDEELVAELPPRQEHDKYANTTFPISGFDD